ncbi:TIGR04157 family glycosyltransferase [Capnocytophaga felis]|uniref:Glycosyl transferase n=1 Tax=Capnocytophaga felis TaxID=2267611 RepID=A0A5M4BBS4_9FLAO|nr:TIGR04157 family glycosyltransferase [Capnocytophaga felis]GET47029.1 glycosyl transferase [Capnocytophaga felis]GET49580.1 glycosyl transferase [Capnocytophaga felis]
MKKNIYIFNEKGIAAMYGVGTFIKDLRGCFTDSMYNLTLINFNTNTNEVRLSCDDSTNIIDIPEPKFSLQKKHNTYYKNLVFLLRQLIPHHKEKNIFFFNYQCDGQMISSLRKYYPRTQMIFIIHFLDWSLQIFGNTKAFKTIISKKKLCTEKEKKVFQMYKEELDVLNNADKVICLSQYTKQLLSEQYKINPKKIHLIYNGLLDKEDVVHQNTRKQLKRSLHFEEEEKIILYVGRLDSHKGGVELIRAFKILLDTNPNCRLVIIGSGDDSMYFEQIKGIWAKVIFTGKLDNDTVSKFYQIADVGVLPSFSEQCSYVAIEMMMHGLPIIGTDSTGLSEMIIDGINGYKVKLRESNNLVLLDTSKLSKLIKKVIETPELRKKLSEGARRHFLLHYTFDLMKKQYRDIVRE